MGLTFADLQPSGNFEPNDMLTICDIGSSNHYLSAFYEVFRPQAFSGSTLLNILNTSSLFVN